MDVWFKLGSPGGVVGCLGVGDFFTDVRDAAGQGDWAG